MKTIKTVLVVFFATTLFFSCDNDSDPLNNVCEENYVTNAITSAFTSGSTYDDIPDQMGAEFQEYEIQINADGEICSIGYEAPSTYTLGEYEIRIFKNGTPVYDELHTFSQTFNYQSLVSVITVASGDIIRVSRVMPTINVIDETLGRVIVRSDWSEIVFPITVGNVTFLSSRFYGERNSWAYTFGGNVGSIENKAIPYIGLGFEVY